MSHIVMSRVDRLVMSCVVWLESIMLIIGNCNSLQSMNIKLFPLRIFA